MRIKNKLKIYKLTSERKLTFQIYKKTINDTRTRRISLNVYYLKAFIKIKIKFFS